MRRLLEKKGVLAPGCPPFRPARAAIDARLVGLGLLDRAAQAAAFRMTPPRCFEDYQRVDASWQPGQAASPDPAPTPEANASRP